MNNVKLLLEQKGLEKHLDFLFKNDKDSIEILDENGCDIKFKKYKDNNYFIVNMERLNDKKDTTYIYTKQMTLEEIDKFIDSYLNIKDKDETTYTSFISDSIKKYKMKQMLMMYTYWH